MTWGDFWGRFKIFLWYLGTEPFRQLRDVVRLLKRLLQILSKTMTWAYVALALAIISYLLGRRILAGLSLLYLLVIILIWEWQSGFFIRRYREVTAQRIKKTLEEQEAHRNAPVLPDRRNMK